MRRKAVKHEGLRLDIRKILFHQLNVSIKKDTCSHSRLFSFSSRGFWDLH